MSKQTLSIIVVGGGPAGPYLVILVKNNRPDLAVSILERNTPQDAYGFGVVISDETLDHLQEADEPSYGAMTESFRHWRDRGPSSRRHRAGFRRAWLRRHQPSGAARDPHRPGA